MSILATIRLWVFVAAPGLLAPVASASESAVPPLELAASAPAASTPLVLGAPPAWTVMALGATVVSLTVLRRLRKQALPAPARRSR